MENYTKKKSWTPSAKFEILDLVLSIIIIIVLVWLFHVCTIFMQIL